MNATESIIAHLGMLPDGVRIVRPAKARQEAPALGLGYSARPA